MALAAPHAQRRGRKARRPRQLAARRAHHRVRPLPLLRRHRSTDPDSPFPTLRTEDCLTRSEQPEQHSSRSTSVFRLLRACREPRPQKRLTSHWLARALRPPVCGPRLITLPSVLRGPTKAARVCSLSPLSTTPTSAQDEGPQFPYCSRRPRCFCSRYAQAHLPRISSLTVDRREAHDDEPKTSEQVEQYKRHQESIYHCAPQIALYNEARKRAVRCSQDFPRGPHADSVCDTVAAGPQWRGADGCRKPFPRG